MKKIRIFALALLLLLLALAFASCEFETASPTPGNDAAATTNTTTATTATTTTTATTDTEESDPIPKNQEAKLVSAEGFTVNENTLSLSVPNATASYSFLNKITVSEGATWSVCLDEFGLQHSLTKTVPLEIGDNTFYLIVSAKNDETISVYLVSIRRRPIYTVTFNTAGGNAVDPAQVEEDGVIVPPVDPTRTCHAFAGWDVDLALPVTGDLTVTANWTAEHTWSTEYTVDREQTCTVPGSKSYHCTRCGAKDPTSVTEIPASHVWGDVVVDTKPTCSSFGSQSRYCTRCHAQDPMSVTRISKLPHTPADNYTIDLKPNCTEVGYKSKHCTVCGAICTETIEVIDADPSRHVVEEWTVTTPVTMFNQTGARTGECTVCHDPVNEVLTFEPTVLVCTDTTSSAYATEGVAFADILGDKHFYPTNEDPTGNDLLIEYSVLFNETMLDLYEDTNNAPYITARLFRSEPILYWSPANNIGYSDCKYAGGFEWMGNFSTPISDAEVTTPATMCGVNPNYSDYPNIGGADPDNPEWGWHRIQIRVHQALKDEAAVKSGVAGGTYASDYVATVTVYIDGTAAFKLSTGTKGLQNIENNLFLAEADGNGGITYTDGNASVIAFHINRTRAMPEKTAYIVLADINVTCGKDFVQRVEKVADPEEVLFEVEDGVEIPAPIYYRLVEN